jgi:hypothetical protein
MNLVRCRPSGRDRAPSFGTAAYCLICCISPCSSIAKLHIIVMGFMSTNMRRYVLSGKLGRFADAESRRYRENVNKQWESRMRRDDDNIPNSSYSCPYHLLAITQSITSRTVHHQFRQ